MKKNLLASAVALNLMAPAFAYEYYVVVPNQGKDDFARLTDVALTPLALPSGKVGEPYVGFNFNSVLSVTGDPNFTTEQVVWSVASGQLPEGLTLNPDGTLTGTPTAGTTADGQGFTVRAAYLSKNDAESYRVTVKVAIALAGATLPEGIVGQSYPGVDLKPLVSVDGDAGFSPSAVSWRLDDGHALPAGLTLNPNGTITGTPSATTAGQDFTVNASYRSEAASQAYSIKVTSASFSFNPTINANTQNYNLRNAALAAGWDAKMPLAATVTVEPGVTIGSSSTTIPAFDTGELPQGSSIVLINNGLIVGAGGKGGTGGSNNGTLTAPSSGANGGSGLKASSAMEVRNFDTIAGGGGGGGGGGYGDVVVWVWNGSYCTPVTTLRYGGGGGGGGAGDIVGSGGSRGQSGLGQAAAGAVGSLYAGGLGGNSANAPAANGGAGGGLGTSGSPGSSGRVSWTGDCNTKNQLVPGAPGGSAGAAVIGNSNITWVVIGTRLGALQ